MNDMSFTHLAHIRIEKASSLSGRDVDELCDATQSMLTDKMSFTIGFSFDSESVKEKLESYWKGVLLVPERILFIGKLDNVIAASLQLALPPPSRRATSFAANVENHFVAPWARGHGLAKVLLKYAEDEALKHGCTVLKLSVREDQEGAVKLYENAGYMQWGVLPKYEIIDNEMKAGYFYYKDLV